MPTCEKFKKSLEEFEIDQELIDQICCGYEKINDKANKSIRCAFFKQALKIMNDQLPQEKVQAILEANACCKSGARLKNSKEFARINANLGINEKLALISSRPYLNMGKANIDVNGDLIIHAVNYQVDNKYECACPSISRTKDNIMPKEYCYCCGGHFKFHYEIMLNAKLKLIEIVSSPHSTNKKKSCVFKYQIIK